MSTPTTVASAAASSPSNSAPLPDLPPELLLAFAEPRHGQDQADERDALDTFVLGGGAGQGGVQVEDILNELLPDGERSDHLFACAVPTRSLTLKELPRRGVRLLESSLNQAALVSFLLRNKIQTIRLEIEALTELLEQDQDPVKMGEIQELIGVSASLLPLLHELTFRFARTGVAVTSDGDPRCRDRE